MAVFKDRNDREWTLAVNVGTIERVREQCGGFDLLEAAGGAEATVFHRLATDPILLVRVIAALCEPEKHGVSLESFYAAMVGDAIDRGATALMEEIVNFTPSPELRAIQKRALAKAGEVRSQGLAMLEETLTDEAMQKAMAAKLTRLRQKLQEELVSLSGDSPE
jgi:hypothetical protein